MLIPLTRGKFAKIDAKDFDLVNQFCWYFDGGYAVHGSGDGKKPKVWMHRIIAKTPSGFVTDHINGNKLDNRRRNLRICTRQQNNMHVGVSRKNKSGYKGVFWNKQRKKWRARIRLNKQDIVLGHFTNKADAAISYNAAAKKYFGEFCFLNTV